MKRSLLFEDDNVFEFHVHIRSAVQLQADMAFLAALVVFELRRYDAVDLDGDIATDRRQFEIGPLAAFVLALFDGLLAGLLNPATPTGLVQPSGFLRLVDFP